MLVSDLIKQVISETDDARRLKAIGHFQSAEVNSSNAQALALAAIAQAIENLANKD